MTAQRDASEVPSGDPQPLTGVRVVSTALNLPGPIAAARFVGLGAEVTKVEPPGGDPLATVAPEWYSSLKAGQHLEVLDLKADGRRQRVEELLARADLLLTSSRPSALARLGLSWQQLAERHPRLCQVAIVGESAPRAERAGHDLTYQARAGTLQPPAMPTLPVADLAGAERAVAEGLAALLQQARTGRGCYREVALAGVIDELAESVRQGVTGTPEGVLGGGLPAYRLYRAADGWVALAALEPHFRRRLHELLGANDDVEELRRVFLTRSAQEWERWADEHDLPLAAVR